MLLTIGNLREGEESVAKTRKSLAGFINKSPTLLTKIDNLVYNGYTVKKKQRSRIGVALAFSFANKMGSNF